jgi:hypothetical protein
MMTMKKQSVDFESFELLRWCAQMSRGLEAMVQWNDLKPHDQQLLKAAWENDAKKIHSLCQNFDPKRDFTRGARMNTAQPL